MKNKELIKLLLEYPLDAEVTTYNKDWGDYQSNFRVEEHKDVTLVKYTANNQPRLVSSDVIAIII